MNNYRERHEALRQRLLLNAGPRLEAPLELQLGLDFGTCFTKVCFRDTIQEHSGIVTFADRLADPAEAMLPSVVGLTDDGLLLAGLTLSEWQQLHPQPRRKFRYLKMHLAAPGIPCADRGWHMRREEELQDQENVAALSTFFLMRVIQRAIRWVMLHEHERTLGRQLNWSISLGVPVEYCDAPAMLHFGEVLRLACALFSEAGDETISLSDLRSSLRQLRDTAGLNSIQAEVIPEISAAVHSFIYSRESHPGLYVYFDVGGGTLDGVSFKYWRHDGEPQLNFYAGLVSGLGVNALAEIASTRLGRSVDDLLELLRGTPDLKRSWSAAPAFIQPAGRTAPGATCPPSGQDSPNPAALPALLEAEQKQIHTLVAKILLEVKKKDPLALEAPPDNRVLRVFQEVAGTSRTLQLPLFLGGGGGRIRFFQSAIINAFHQRNLGHCGIPPFCLVDPPLLPDLDMSGIPAAHSHRFTIAYGLSIPTGDRFRSWLPRYFEPLKLGTPKRRPSLDYDDTHDCQ